MIAGGEVNWEYIDVHFTWRNHRLPSSTRINSSVGPSIRLSVHVCRLGIERKMAQARQIQSIIPRES